MTTKESIEKRWSPRSFIDKAIPNETFLSIIESAKKAPSAFNEQPWRIIAGIKGTASYDKVLSGLNEFNREWASTAPIILIGLIKKSFQKNGNPNSLAIHDLGAFSSYLSLRAMQEDIYVHQMAGILPDAIRETFDIPEDYEAITGIAMGYLGDKSQLPENLAAIETSESPRKELKEILFADEWEKPF